MNLDTQLKDLDPARGIADGLATEPRARATLASIVDGHTPRTETAVRRRRRPRPVWYAVTAGVAAAVVLVGTNLSGDRTAYASWTATAQVANPSSQEAQWGRDCLSVWTYPDEGHRYRVRFVEVRGDYAFTVLTGDDGYAATCLMKMEGPGNGEPTGGAAESVLKQNPSAGGLVSSEVDAQWGDDGEAAFNVIGKVGSDVTSITLVTDDGKNVHATVKDGYFAAWWPGQVSSEPTDADRNPLVRITLSDGTVRTAHIEDFVVPD